MSALQIPFLKPQHGWQQWQWLHPFLRKNWEKSFYEIYLNVMKTKRLFLRRKIKWFGSWRPWTIVEMRYYRCCSVWRQLGKSRESLIHVCLAPVECGVEAKPTCVHVSFVSICQIFSPQFWFVQSKILSPISNFKRVIIQVELKNMIESIC